MTNGEKFKALFGLYATELWAKSETEFLKWLNADANELFEKSEQLTSKQAAINAAIEAIDDWDGEYSLGRKKILIRDAIMALPAADTVVAKHGHWIKWRETVADCMGIACVPHYRCSECNLEYDPYDAMRINFCHNCGAKMDGEDVING